MYLSRLILNPRSRAVARDLSNCQDLHRSVMSAFPNVDNADKGARSQLGVLHRLEKDARSGEVVLLVQSEIEPDWDKLPEGYLLETLDRENPACKDISGVYAALESGAVLGFRLRANPTRKVHTDREAQPNGKRVAITEPEEQIEWLARKAELGGFELVHGKNERPQVRVSSDGGPSLNNGHKRSARGGHRLYFGSVTFEGYLRVTDPEQFQNTLREGIGSAKSYGFGLLSIAPPRALQSIAA